MQKIKTILIERDDMTAEEAQALIDEAMSQLDELIRAGDFDEAGDICQSYFGLEPDYLEGLIL